MTRYFVSRHPGAIAWAELQPLQVDKYVSHLDASTIRPGDVVMGTLPVTLAAQVCAQGASYLHLNLQLPANLRGTELSTNQMQQLHASLQLYHVQAGVGPPSKLDGVPLRFTPDIRND